MAPNSDLMIIQLASFLTEYFETKTEIKIKFEFESCNGDWKQRTKLLDDQFNDVAIGWVCGFPYCLAAYGHTNGLYSCRDNDDDDEETQEPKSSFRNYSLDRPFAKKENQIDPSWKPLCAPVFALSSRYGGEPIYFSDVIILKKNKDRFKDFKSLVVESAADVKWGYNEKHSQSGYNLPRSCIVDLFLNEDETTTSSTKTFKPIQLGSHLECIKAVLDGRIDAAAIDSIVLETEFRKIGTGEELKDKLEIISVLGPSPSPPIVVNQTSIEHAIFQMGRDDAYDLSQKIQQMIAQALVVELPNNKEWRAKILNDFGLFCFRQVDESNYQPIREMLKKSLRMEHW
jgi:ABC-type phosphate/phosphonate transport system substrate-binding protein